jgi:hypothetical protein
LIMRIMSVVERHVKREFESGVHGGGAPCASNLS